MVIMMTTILSVKNLKIGYFHYSKFSKKLVGLIDESDFDINENEVVLIQGANGSGKTSILKAITFQHNRNMSITEDVYFRNELINAQNIDEKMYPFISFTPQKPKFYAYSGMDYVKQKCDNYYYRKEITDESIKNMFQYFGKSGIEKRRISSLSGGELRILSLVSAFIREKADLFILDEPLNDLDYETAKKVSEYITKIKLMGKSILLISHCRMHLNADRAYIIQKEENHPFPKLIKMTRKPNNCSPNVYSECECKKE
jgi:ABC-type multidrug transport system ATPase subunit